MKYVNRLRSLDVLRGMAALLVVWQHAAETLIKLPEVAQNGHLLADIAWTVDFGRIGVICFFLISGFVVPFSLRGNAHSAGNRKFIIRRFFRLFPAYWFSLLVAVVVGYLYQINYDFYTVLSNLTMLQSFFGQSHIQGLYWTLQVELVFYIICIALYNLGALQNNRLLFFIIVSLFLLFVFGQVARQYIFQIQLEDGASIVKELMYMPYLIAIMFLGTLMRQVYDAKTPDKELVLLTSIGITVCFGLPLFLLITALFGFELTQYSIRFGASHCLALALFIFGLIFFNRVPKIFTWLGVISYSIYLFHPFVVHGLMLVLESNQIEFMQNLHLGIYILIVFMITILVASLIYWCIEKPSMNFGKRITENAQPKGV